MDPHTERPADVPADRLTDDELIAAIGSGAARIAALQCRFLLLAAEVDRRRIWAGWGMSSATAWLSWRCGVDAVTAREQLRVGHALTGLPLVRAAFAEGRLSYSKVRALTRVATPDDEAGWVGTATSIPAQQLHVLTRSYRKAIGSDQRRARRSVRWSWDDDGMLVLSARLAPEEGALVLSALQQASDALTAACGTGEADERNPQAVDSAEACRDRPVAADALTLMAHTSLAVGPSVPARTEPYQVVLHLAADRQHLHGAPSVDDATARRISCDATITALLHGDAGEVRSVGRRMRRIPPVLRRALDDRDHGCCRFPGCSNTRWVQAHHVVHWHDGGPTELGNLLLLCSFHHAQLHDDAFTLAVTGTEQFVFLRPDGSTIEPAPRLADLPESPLRPSLLPEVEVSPTTIAGHWDGARLDLDWAVLVFAGNRALRQRAAAATGDSSDSAAA